MAVDKRSAPTLASEDHSRLQRRMVHSVHPSANTHKLVGRATRSNPPSLSLLLGTKGGVCPDGNPRKAISNRCLSAFALTTSVAARPGQQIDLVERRQKGPVPQAGQTRRAHNLLA